MIQTQNAANLPNIFLQRVSNSPWSSANQRRVAVAPEDIDAKNYHVRFNTLNYYTIVW